MLCVRNVILPLAKLAGTEHRWHGTARKVIRQQRCRIQNTEDRCRQGRYRVLLFYHLDHFCRNTADDGIGRDIFGHYRSCGNDGVLADGDALQNGYIRTEPHFFADVYRFGYHACPLRYVLYVIIIIVLCLSVQRGAKVTFSFCQLRRNRDVRGAEG